MLLISTDLQKGQQKKISNSMDSEISNHIGRKFTFGDGRSLKIIQVKFRDLGHGAESWVTCEIDYNNSFPKRVVLSEGDFIGKFGHLFFNN